jgi:hypothetical protein
MEPPMRFVGLHVTENIPAVVVVNEHEDYQLRPYAATERCGIQLLKEYAVLGDRAFSAKYFERAAELCSSEDMRRSLLRLRGRGKRYVAVYRLVVWPWLPAFADVCIQG